MGLFLGNLGFDLGHEGQHLGFKSGKGGARAIDGGEGLAAKDESFLGVAVKEEGLPDLLETAGGCGLTDRYKTDVFNDLEASFRSEIGDHVQSGPEGVELPIWSEMIGTMNKTDADKMAALTEEIVNQKLTYGPANGGEMAAEQERNAADDLQKELKKHQQEG